MTYQEKQNAFLKLKDGDMVLFNENADSSTNVIGIITIELGEVFVCQDHIAGADCLDKKGYDFSWFIGNDMVSEMDVQYISILENKQLPLFT